MRRLIIYLLLATTVLGTAYSSSKTSSEIIRIEEIRKIVDTDLGKLNAFLSAYEKTELKPREEIAASTIVSMFRDYIEEDINAGRYQLALREASECRRVVKDALIRMESGSFILSHDKSVLDLKLKNGRFMNPRGETVYLLGYCHSNTGCPDFSLKKALGINLESLPWGLALNPANGDDYTISAPFQYWFSNPEERYKHNIALNILPYILDRPQYEEIVKIHPEIKVTGNHYLDLDPDHPAVQRLLDKAAAAYGKGYADLPNYLKGVVVGFNLANEPAFSSITNYTMQAFRSYLKGKYGSITSLNKDWQTSYAGFESIDDIRPLLQDTIHKVARYDWCVFNQQRFYNTFKLMRDSVRSQTGGNGPNIHVKFMNVETWYPYYTFDRGENREMLDSIEDINGGDGGPWELPDTSPYSVDWLTIALTNDYLRSISPGKPILDDEWHSINKSMTDPQMRAILWLAAWHGQSGTDLFGMFRDKKRDMLYGSMPYQSDSWYDFTRDYGADQRPSLMNAYSQEGIRIQNKIEDIRRFAEAEKPVCIYHSMSSCLYDGKQHVEAVESLYDVFSYSNVGVGFVTESMLKGKGTLPRGLKLLVIANARYIDPEAIAGLRKLEEKGVRILLAGEDNLTRDLHDKLYSPKPIFKNAITWKARSVDEYRAQVSDVLKLAKIASPFTVKDITGRRPEYVAAQFVIYGKKKTGYAINLGKKPKEFSIVDPAGKVVKIKNWFNIKDTRTTIHLAPCEFINFDIVD